MSEAAADDVVLYESDGPRATLTINRPDRRNALNPEVVRALGAGLDRAEADENIRVLVLTGSGDRAFCAGADLGGMVAEDRVAQHLERAEIGNLFSRMRRNRLPIVARANGHALAGGFGLLLACDVVIAADDVEIGTPEINLGLWPYMISAVLMRDIPRKIAVELMLTGRRMPVEEGARYGFVNRVVPRDTLDKAVDEMVEAIASKSPLTVSLGKRSFYRAEDMSFDDAIAYLAGMLTVTLESEDAVEGVTAWLQKRAPEWKGR